MWWGYLSYLTRVFQLYFWRCGWTELKYSRYYSISFYTLKFRAFIFRSRLSLKNVILNNLAFKLLLFGTHIQNLLSFQNTDRDQIPCVCLLSVINTDMIFKILIFNKYIRIVLLKGYCQVYSLNIREVLLTKLCLLQDVCCWNLIWTNGLY